MMHRYLPMLVVLPLLSAASAAQATVYTFDTNVSDFTSGISNYATFTNTADFSDLPLPYTPTAAIVATGSRVFGNNLNPAVNVAFSSAVSAIRVFANIDHPGGAFDGFQYTILGSNDGVTFTQLFDALTVIGSGEPFTLGAFTGTAPTTVNNAITTACGPGGCVGYIADFSFAQGFKFYEFGASTVAINSGNPEPEFTAVAAVAEPPTWAMMLAGLAMVVGLVLKRRAVFLGG